MRTTLFLIYLSFPFTCFLQFSSAQLSYKHGFLIAHRVTMAHLPEENTNGFELSAFLNEKAKLQQHLKNHAIGISFIETSAGNNDILGRFFGTMGFIEFNHFKEKKLTFNPRIGCGIAYATKVFNQAENPKNIAVSSRLNALINAQFILKYKLQKSSLGFGIDMTHFSNGSSKIPNLGLNIPSLSANYTYKFNVNPHNYTPFTFENNWKLALLPIVTFKETYALKNKRYPVYAFSLRGYKLKNTNIGYMSSFDFMMKESISQYKPSIEKTKLSMFQLGLSGGWIFSIADLQTHVGMGMYLRDNYDADGLFYHRVGFSYTLNKHVLINLTLKSHWAKADYLEYGIGYVF